MEKLNIEINKNEALVLFEFLARINQSINNDIFENKAEEIVCGNIESSLERILAEPFLKNYIEILEEAKREICKLE